MMHLNELAIFLGIFSFLQLGFIIRLITQFRRIETETKTQQARIITAQAETLSVLQDLLQKNFLQTYEKLTHSQLAIQELISSNVQQHMQDVRAQISQSFKQHADSLTSHLQSLTEQIKEQLQQLSGQVNHRLAEGFEKTSSTFTDIVRRLAIIDEAQKKITELSSHVVSLQDILADKKSRGAFGEVQLAALISNALPSSHYSMQHTLSNDKRPDCILFLPDPTGNLVIDAKFPLESYQKFIILDPTSTERKRLQQQFRQDLQKHIKDIAEKYIIAEETADGAIMFIPAEAIFAEIHANYPEIVALSQKQKVWIVSPSTLMAVLTTARAVLKDDATKRQVHIIQKHLHALANDFMRFEKRMEKLTQHIDKAQQDANEVNISARKITQQFQKIERVELAPLSNTEVEPCAESTIIDTIA